MNIPSNVLFVIAKDAENNPVTYPALVTNVQPAEEGQIPTVNLQVLLDGQNALTYGFTPDDCAQGLCWKGTVPHGDEVGQWMFESIDVEEVDPDAEKVEAVVRAAIAAYEVCEGDPDASLAAALEAAVDTAQGFDLADGVDDENENPDEFRPFIALAIAAYQQAPGDQEDGILVAIAAVLQARANQEGKGEEGQGGPTGRGNPAPGQKNGDAFIVAGEWFAGVTLPAGPDGVADGVGDVGPDYIWAPLTPVIEDATPETSWGWRPAPTA